MLMKELFSFFYHDDEYYYLEWLYKDPSGKEHLINIKGPSREQSLDKYTDVYQVRETGREILRSQAIEKAIEMYRDYLFLREDLDIIALEADETGVVRECV